jgi:hypothetical protein
VRERTGVVNELAREWENAKAAIAKCIREFLFYVYAHVWEILC